MFHMQIMEVTNWNQKDGGGVDLRSQILILFALITTGVILIRAGN
ncbi:hypothetical protein ES703_36130 [subsurface metagenome]